MTCLTNTSKQVCPQPWVVLGLYLLKLTYLPFPAPPKSSSSVRHGGRSVVLYGPDGWPVWSLDHARAPRASQGRRPSQQGTPRSLDGTYPSLSRARLPFDPPLQTPGLLRLAGWRLEVHQGCAKAQSPDQAPPTKGAVNYMESHCGWREIWLMHVSVVSCHPLPLQTKPRPPGNPSAPSASIVTTAAARVTSAANTLVAH